MIDLELSGRMLGEFLVRERIGLGGYGVVYRCVQRRLERDAVVKVSRSRSEDSVGIERFMREARLAAQLDHPFSAHVYAFGVEGDGVRWIAMELVRGLTLGAYLSGSCRDILEHRAALWRFVDDPAVEPTNNHGERELRGLVTWRKSSFGSQSERGNTFAANLKSVIQTCRKQHQNVLAYLTSAIQAALHHQSAPSLLRPTR